MENIKYEQTPIIKGGKYRIQGRSKYFKEKYNTYNPIIRIEGKVVEMDEHKPWDGLTRGGNMAAVLYGVRMVKEELPADDNVYYGKIDHPDGSGATLGEMVHETELEDFIPKTSFWEDLKFLIKARKEGVKF